jgi:hypothetical protein
MQYERRWLVGKKERKVFWNKNKKELHNEQGKC